MSEEKLVNAQPENVEEEEFVAGGLATIAGASISWVALFAAICAVTSLIPFYFYVTGGGYVSLGSGLFMPLAGQVLGPWAGAVASFVGGLVGMFIAPGAFPLGLVDILLSATIIGFSYGLMAKRWRWLFLAWWIINLILVAVYPFRIPGSAAGFAPPEEPQYTLSWWYVFLGFLTWLALGPLTTNLLHKWSSRGSSTVMQTIGLVLIGFVGRTAFQPLWSLPYYHILEWPADWVVFDNSLSLVTYLLNWVATGVLALVVFRALWQAKLRRVPGSLVAELGRSED